MDKQVSEPQPFEADTPKVETTGSQGQYPSSSMDAAFAKIWGRIGDLEREEVRSRSSRTSGRSKASSTLSARAALAAEAAALKAQLEFADVEAAKHAELEKNQRELQKLQKMRDLHATEARIEAIDKAEREEHATLLTEVMRETESKTSRVEDYIRSLQTPNIARGEDNKSSTRSVSPERPLADIPQSDQDTTATTPSQLPIENETASMNAHTALQGLTRTFAEQINLSRLPTPEPGVFTGDPLKFPRWKRAFEILIEQRGIPRSERLHYLQIFTY